MKIPSYMLTCPQCHTKGKIVAKGQYVVGLKCPLCGKRWGIDTTG